MTRILVLSLSALLLCSVAAAADVEVFSNHRGPFVVQDVDSERHITRFSGEIVLTGEIQFSFDQLDESRYGAPLFAKFIPDEQYRDSFPEVVAGFYPRQLTVIGLYDEMATFEAVFGEEMAKELVPGNKPVISVRGQVTLTGYVTSVECDSRQYSARLKAFIPETERVALIAPSNLIDGC